MKTLADLKRQCVPGTLIEFTRVHINPGTEWLLIKECRSADLVVTHIDGRIGYLDWNRAKNWRYEGNIATRLDVAGDQPIVVSHIRFPSEQEAAAKAQEILQVSAANITNNEEGRAIAQWLTQLAAAPQTTPSTQEAEKTYALTQWQMDVLLSDVTYLIARYAYKRPGDFEPSEPDEGKSIDAADLYHLLEELRQQHQAL